MVAGQRLLAITKRTERGLRIGCSSSFPKMDSPRLPPLVPPPSSSSSADEERYQCSLCDKQYANASNLGRHIRQVHPAATKAKSCFLCGHTCPRGEKELHQHAITCRGPS